MALDIILALMIPVVGLIGYFLGTIKERMIWVDRLNHEIRFSYGNHEFEIIEII